MIPSRIKFPDPPTNDSPKQDLVEFEWIFEFLRLRGIPNRMDEFIPLILRYQPDDLRKFCQLLQYSSAKFPGLIFDPLNIPITIGWKTNSREGSYTKLEYPIGKPLKTGQSKNDGSVCNYDWIACEYQSDDSRKHTAIIPQVNESLEEIEDRHCMLDIEIVRNSNALRYFMTNGADSTAFSSPMIQLEMCAIYGNGGTLILETYSQNPNLVHPIIVNRLIERAIQLRKEKLQMMSRWSMNLEKVLPAQRAKYMTFAHFKKEITEFSEIGSKPIVYDASLAYLLDELVNVYCELIEGRDLSEFNALKEVVSKIIVDLRKPPNSEPFPATFSYCTSLCTGAMILSEIGFAREMDSRANKGVRIPLEIGITKRDMHGHRRMIRVMAETIIKKKWSDGIRELAGQLLPINLDKALLIIRTGHLFIKCLDTCIQNEFEPNIALCTVRNGVVKIESITQQGAPLVFNLAKFEQ
ncbi:hypothetical protein GPJ56_003929 [Histomonas meleagridis]|uniref:uncharacterized protein n=1 Tax=Histomonas meleagridis TaxID=135588 RepID=UPI0035595189|nr:hypothetical protein GPJ56_003929 [Histomonas meleagridis]KAH0797528.1 hypothetical protein GO595_009631 [Histomonas meleagridis]